MEKNQNVPDQRHFVTAALHICSQFWRLTIVYIICLWLNHFCSILLNKYQKISPFCHCGWNIDIFRSDLWPQFHKNVTTLDFYDQTFLIVHVFLFPSIYHMIYVCDLPDHNGFTKWPLVAVLKTSGESNSIGIFNEWGRNGDYVN